MNLQIIIHENIYIKRVLIFALSFFCITASADWKIDLSRRVKDLKPIEKKMNYRNNNTNKRKRTVFNYFKGEAGPAQEIVIINTEKGFLPSKLNLKSGERYKIYVVNINSKFKNASFIMEDFSEHHGTYFGEKQAFVLHPKKEGVYRFVSPETGAQGQVIVHSKSSIKRRLASE